MDNSKIKLLSYNIYGVLNSPKDQPSIDIRIKNMVKELNKIFLDDKIKIAFFQEVNHYNLGLLIDTLHKNGFEALQLFPMIVTELVDHYQYNIVAVKKELVKNIEEIKCIPHGKDQEYVDIKNQHLDFGMSDYRTSVLVKININGEKYIVSNIHTDHLSETGRINGVNKTLNYFSDNDAKYKIVLGDMNMHPTSEFAQNLVKSNPDYAILMRDKELIPYTTYHGYGVDRINGEVDVDFAFVEKAKLDNYKYEIVKQDSLLDEGSDHRPIIITIKK